MLLGLGAEAATVYRGLVSERRVEVKPLALGWTPRQYLGTDVFPARPASPSVSLDCRWPAVARVWDLSPEPDLQIKPLPQANCQLLHSGKGLPMALLGTWGVVTLEPEGPPAPTTDPWKETSRSEQSGQEDNVGL